MNTILRSCISLVFLLMLLPAPASATDGTATTPEALIERVSDDLLQLIEDSRDYVTDDQDRFFKEVEALLAPAVDFRGFARGVMAVHYKRASDDQRERFTETFKWGLVRTYALALTEFKDGEIVLVPDDRPAQNPRRKNVKMEIRMGSGAVYPITYSMKQSKEGEWRLGNIIVNGVNIGLTYRSQFASAVQDQKYQGDLDQVIEAWAEVLVNDEQPAPGLQGI